MWREKKVRAQKKRIQTVCTINGPGEEAWDDERRKYERKIHVAESRLKMLLDEVAAYQAQMNNAHEVQESEVEESGKENDAASIRTMSITNSVRFSVMTNGVKPPNGNSLADELNFDTEYDDETDYGGRESVLSTTRHNRNASRDSAMSRTHRRKESNDSLMRPGSVARGRLAMHHSTLEKLEDRIIKEDDETLQQAPPTVQVNYTDTGIQYSPPPSPKMKPVKPSTPEPPALPTKLERFYEVESPPRMEGRLKRTRGESAFPATWPSHWLSSRLSYRI